ncbi:hypothetical protein SAMN05443247_09516 [Bradyrhizobium erythrophlei]|jgi:hypothetical protein|nr:hypothetical protein SAMN05443247_09516 [Bradyrhizobium erythrophlei]
MSFDGRLLAGITVLAAVVQGRSFVRAGETLAHHRADPDFVR